MGLEAGGEGQHHSRRIKMIPCTASGYITRSDFTPLLRKMPPDGDAMNTQQVPHGEGVTLLNGGSRHLFVLHGHRIDRLPDELLLYEELCRQGF